MAAPSRLLCYETTTTLDEKEKHAVRSFAVIEEIKITLLLDSAKATSCIYLSCTTTTDHSCTTTDSVYTAEEVITVSCSCGLQRSRDTRRPECPWRTRPGSNDLKTANRWESQMQSGLLMLSNLGLLFLQVLNASSATILYTSQSGKFGRHDSPLQPVRLSILQITNLTRILLNRLFLIHTLA
jgi:hypothetical protein